MATKDVKLEHFTGKNTIEADHWLNLFEVVCAELTLTTAQKKTVKLMSYLKDDALAFFAQRIAPNISTITWAEVRSLITKRFGTPQVSSIISAKERRLHRYESVKEYFDEKMKHLDKTSLVDSERCDLLTDGIYDEFKKHLLPITFTSTEDWLQRAMRIEVGLKRDPSHTKPDNKDIQFKQYKPKPNHSFALNTTNNSAPYPCRYCQFHGKEEYHWHSECPVKAKYRNQPIGNSSSNSNGNNRNHTSFKTLATSQRQPSRDSSADSSSETPIAGNSFAQPTGKALPLVRSGSDPYPSLDVTLNCKPFKAIIDSGSTISFVTEQTFKSLNTQLIPNSSIEVTQLCGQIQTIGCFKAKLQISNKLAEINLHVIPKLQTLSAVRTRRRKAI